MSAHIQRLPQKGRMSTDQLLHCPIHAKKFGMDLPVIIEPCDELALFADQR